MMRRIKDSVKTRLRNWLGIADAYEKAQSAMILARNTENRLASLCTPAADVHFRGNTQIVVISRIQGGTVQFYDLHVEDSRELFERMMHVAGPAWPHGVIDAPHGFSKEMKRRFAL